MYYVFDGDFAKEYGILEAVLYQNILYWVKKNEANSANEHDGRFWTYNTVNAWAELFPFASKDKIRRALDHLVSEGVLLKGNYNQIPYDRTMWYAIGDTAKYNWQTPQIHLANLPNEIGKDAKAIPNINTNNNPDVTTKINYLAVVDMYNEICISFPKMRSLSEARKKAIKARLNTYTLDDFRTLFENAEASDFLKGNNNRNWTATFDWLIKDSNMAKVLDGNYSGSVSHKPKKAQEMDDFYAMVTDWANNREEEE